MTFGKLTFAELRKIVLANRFWQKLSKMAKND